jgi:hypothetical protein
MFSFYQLQLSFINHLLNIFNFIDSVKKQLNILLTSPAAGAQEEVVLVALEYSSTGGGGAGSLFDEMPQRDALSWAPSCWFIVRPASITSLFGYDFIEHSISMTSFSVTNFLCDFCDPLLDDYFRCHYVIILSYNIQYLLAH